MDDSSMKSLSLDYLNLLINGQAFSDVTFSVDGRLVPAHRCILAARSLFFRKFFCAAAAAAAGDRRSPVIPVGSVGYEVFLLVLQFLYSGQVSVVPPKHEPRPNCGDRGCWHTHCSSAVDLALDTLAAAQSFGVEQLALLTQKQLSITVEKASIEDVMRVLLASRTHDLPHLWSTCSRLVANSGLPPEVLAKHLPLDILSAIHHLRLDPRRHVSIDPDVSGEHRRHQISRMRRALDASDVELVRLMVMGEGLDLDEALALHYAVRHCTREVVKALLELGAADVDRGAGPAGRTALHVAAEMASPDMVAVLLDHHADPNARTSDGVTPLDVLRSLTSDFLFKGAVPGLTHIEPNKLRLCLELVQSAALVASREDAAAAAAASDNSDTAICPTMSSEAENCNGRSGNANLDSRMVHLNLGMTNAYGSHSGGGIGPSSMFSPHDYL